MEIYGGPYLPLTGGTLKGSVTMTSGATLAVNGATIGSDALAVTGAATISGNLTGGVLLSNGRIQAATASAYSWGSRNWFSAPADGAYRFMANNDTTGAYLEGVEMSAPSAPAANGFRIYAADSGGKTALMVVFGSGAAQQIAIEP